MADMQKKKNTDRGGSHRAKRNDGMNDPSMQERDRQKNMGERHRESTNESRERRS